MKLFRLGQLHARRWLRRPVLVRADVAPVVLPGGRSVLIVEVRGWGLLTVDDHRTFVRDDAVLRFVVPVGTRLALRVRNPLGSDRRELFVPATVAAAPELPRAPLAQVPVPVPSPALALRAAVPRLRAIEPPEPSYRLLRPRLLRDRLQPSSDKE